MTWVGMRCVILVFPDHTHLRFDTNGAIWYIRSISKVCFNNIEISSFKDKNQKQPKSFALFFSSISNPDGNVSMKTHTFTFYREEIKKNQTNRGLSFKVRFLKIYFLLFSRAS